MWSDGRREPCPEEDRVTSDEAQAGVQWTEDHDDVVPDEVASAPREAAGDGEPATRDPGDTLDEGTILPPSIGDMALGEVTTRRGDGASGPWRCDDARAPASTRPPRSRVPTGARLSRNRCGIAEMFTRARRLLYAWSMSTQQQTPEVKATKPAKDTPKPPQPPKRPAQDTRDFYDNVPCTD
jgi:hypothetical protein